MKLFRQTWMLFLTGGVAILGVTGCQSAGARQVEFFAPYDSSAVVTADKASISTHRLASAVDVNGGTSLRGLTGPNSRNTSRLIIKRPSCKSG